MREKLHKLFGPRAKKRRGRRPPIFVYVGYLLVATVIFTGVTFSGYVSSTMGKDEARVAKFDVDIDTTVPEILIGVGDMMPGDIRSKEIEITNSSEVAVDVIVTAKLMYGNLPLDITFNSMDAKTGASVSMTPGQPLTTYYLTIEWPITENDYTYAGRADMISLSINVVQRN